jgi:hypothetical protein
MFGRARMRLHRRPRNFLSPWIIETKKRPERRVLLELEELESRAMLSATSATIVTPTAPSNTSSTTVVQPLTVMPQQGPGPTSGYVPLQIQQAYGVSSLLSNRTTGKGETIAIVDAYNDPNIASDVSNFVSTVNNQNPSQYQLPQFTATSLPIPSSGGPYLSVVTTGGGSASGLSQNADWALETSLDVEWAHAMAPQANVLLVEAPSDSNTDLFNAVQYAASVPGVVAVSMSWGAYEFSNEASSYDSYFQPRSASNPNGYTNPGVVFVAASGDSGAYSPPFNPGLYPSVSPYVLSVGGTTLSTTTNASGGTVYSSESAWSDSGGGAAQYEGEPSYQSNQSSIGSPDVEVYNPFTGTYSYYSARLAPDVALNADPNTGYAIYDSVAAPDYGFSGGWTVVGGTSAAAPQWAALVALADQQRGSPLDTNQVQTTLYNTLGTSNYSKIFHDITSGSNGYSAGPGYDVATGLGTPIANQLVPFLARTTIPLGQLPTITGSGYGSASSSAGFGSTTFTSFAQSSARTAVGGGLYSSLGSLSIGADFGAAGVSNHGAVPALSLPSATRTPLAVSPDTNPTTANSLSLTSTVIVPAVVNPDTTLTTANNLPLTSPVSAPPSVDRENTPPTANSNPLVSFNTASQGLSSASATGNPLLADVSNASLAQSNEVFGASGLNGPPDSWRLSSWGLNGPQVEQVASDLVGLRSDNEDTSSLPSLGDHSGQITDDAGAEAIIMLDNAPPPLLESDAGGGDG